MAKLKAAFLHNTNRWTAEAQANGCTCGSYVEAGGGMQPQLVKLQSQKFTDATPSLPRQRKRHICYEDKNAAAGFISMPEDHYRRIYYEALDLIIKSITDRFDQPGYFTQT